MSSASGECDFVMDSERMKIRKSKKRRDVDQHMHVENDSVDFALHEEDEDISSDSYDTSVYQSYQEPKIVRRGKNNSFSDYQVREIERKNAVLMSKIDSHNRKPSEYSKTGKAHFTKVSNSQVNRKKKQTQIERENMILLKKIQSVKPFGLSKRK